MNTATATVGSSFTRTRRTAAGVASVGMLAGFSLLAAAPANAATDADCTDSNTLTAPTNDAADIQALLDADTAIICLSGTFDVTTPLIYDHTDLTVHGLADAVLDGGGTSQILLANAPGTLTIENMRFTGGAGVNEGGAIDAYQVTVRNSQFDNNQADLGGAIRAYSADIDGSTFFDNESYFGGAVLTNENAVVTNSTFSNNSVIIGGGAVAAYGLLTSDSSTFVDNTAGAIGGALYSQGGFSVTNSTFVDNTATNEDSTGGAIYGSTGLVLQSTFVNNTAVNGGQAVVVYDADASVRGNIFVGTGTASQVGVDNDLTIADLGGNVFSTAEADETALADVQGSTQFGLSVEAVFAGATLADNGGPTQTVALDGGSPAVNAVPVGEPSVEVDQRGVARDSLSDAGAYEFVAAVAPEGPALANTGSAPATWLGGVAALLAAAGAVALGFSRRIRSAK